MATATTTDPNAVEYDEYGNPIKKTATAAVPAQDPNSPNSTVALSTAAMSGAAAAAPVTSTGYDTGQGNTDVLGQAQQDVLNQPQTSALQDATTKSTMDWVNNPEGDFNAAKNKQQQLDKANSAYAQTFEGLRQQYGDQSGSGLIQKNMLENALQHNTDMGTLESQIDTDNYNKYIDSMSKSIAAGQSVDQSNENAFTQRLGNLQTVRNMGEGERTQTTGFSENVALTNLGFDNATQQAAAAHGYDLDSMNKQFGNTMTQLMATQDFTGAQNALSREATAAIDSNDTQAVAANLQKQLDYNTWALGQGQTFTASQNAINNALQVSLKTLDQQGQKDLATLNGQIQTGQMLTANDFKASEDALDRAAEVAKQNNDLQGQKDILNQKAALDMQAQTSQNDFTKTLTQATQSWQTGERISTEDYQTQSQALDIASKQAIDANDTGTQKYIADQKTALDLQMQTQDMDQQTKIAYLNNSLAEAKADNDVRRQESIIGFQTTQDLNKMATEYGYTAAGETLQEKLKEASDNNNAVNTMAIAKSAQQFEATQNDENRALDQQKIDLQKAGVDMAQMEQAYNQIAAEVQAGRADPSALTDFVNGVAKQAGVTLTQPDPQAAAKVAQKKYDDMLGQFALTHPDDVTYTAPADATISGTKISKGMVVSKDMADQINASAPGTFETTVSDTGAKAFNDFFNSATYGELTPAEQATKDNAGYLTADDLPTAVAGDKFNIDKATTVQDQDGRTINVPVGKYSVISKTGSTGSTFFGTGGNTSDNVLVDSSGNLVATLSRTTTPHGNIVSNLWAGDV